jgi:hypothetical protein
MEGTEDQQNPPPANGQQGPPGGQTNPPPPTPPPGGQQDPPPPPAGGEQQPDGQSGNWFQDLPPPGSETNPPPAGSNPDEALPSTEDDTQGSGSSPAPTAQDNDPDNDEYGPPLVSIPVPKTTEGDDTVGWIESGLRKLFINRYGSRRYGLYSIESDCVDGYAKPQDQNVMSEKNRRGWIPVVPGRSERKYTRKHVDRIMAVAWECKVPGKDNKHIKYKNPVDYINPAKKPARTNYPLTYLWIRWKIEGKYHYAWETRSEMSMRYKGENDTIIYQAACEQAARHEDAAAGRIRDSKSPSVGLADEAVRTQRELSLEADRGGRSRSGTPSRRTPSPGRLDKQALRELMEEFQMMYLVDKEVDSIDELDTTSKNSMFNAWRQYKATELAT